jgi:OPT oligopeptide transporter protein
MMAQALQFTSDMKLGHYMKVPPRSMFFCQIVATVVAGTTQLGVQQWYVSCLTILNGRLFTVHGQDVQ